MGTKLSFIITTLAAAAIMLGSCEKSTYNYIKPRYNAYHPGQSGSTDSTGNNDQFDGKEHLYMTAVEFNDGYDWRKDSEFGDVECKLVVYRDLERILSIPAGKGTEVRPDHDFHHMKGGHLYTECTTGGETIVGRDGKTLFRYEGEERLAGIFSRDGDLYTLGLNKSGKGISFRKNGTALLKRNEATLVGGLYEDSGKLYFSYRNPDKKYYLVCDGIEESLSIPFEMVDVLDIRIVEGRIYAVGKKNSIGNPILSLDGNIYDMSDNGKVSAVTCEIRNEDGVYFIGKIKRSGYKITHSAVWQGTAINVELPDPDIYFLSVNKGMSYIMSQSNGSLSGYSYSLGAFNICIDNYFFDKKCALAHNGDVYITYVPKTVGSFPRLWKNGETTEFGFNGFFTSVGIED